MRFFALASVGLFSLFTLAVSQSLSGLPTCAETCALNSIAATGCAVTDTHCICTATSFLSGVATCITTACSPADQAATLQFAQSYCLSANVTITLPGSAPATSAASMVSSAPASTAASTTTSVVVAVTTSTVPVSSTSTVAPPASTYTGAAQMLRQDWAGVLGAVGLGVAAVL